MTITMLGEFEGVRVLCVGDVMLDRFVQGTVQRISPESPVPIICLGKTDTVPGGAANVARNISSLGGQCTLVACIGSDIAGTELRDVLTQDCAIVADLIEEKGRVTTEKTRFVAHGQHLLRADREDSAPIAPITADRLIARIRALLPEHEVLVLSDYAKGLLTDDVIVRAIGAAQAAGVPVIVDPKSSRLGRYAGASVITPNTREIATGTGIDPSDDAGAEAAVAQVLETCGVKAVLLTRAERGVTLGTSGEPPLHLAASAREVFDVVGAGDTVVATLALGVGASWSLADAAAAANAAGGLVVGKHGTATVTRGELQEEMARLAGIGRSPALAKVTDRALALTRRAAWREQGLSVGFTNGCFDILHVGHLGILQFARGQCDRLIVALNTDVSVTRLKGPGRPVNTEIDRATMIAALGFVDLVLLFDEETPADLIATLVPDVLIKGADYTIQQIVGADTVLAAGGRVVQYELVPDKSTTAIIARARATGTVPSSTLENAV